MQNANANCQWNPSSVAATHSITLIKRGFCCFSETMLKSISDDIDLFIFRRWLLMWIETVKISTWFRNYMLIKYIYSFIFQNVKKFTRIGKSDAVKYKIPNQRWVTLTCINLVSKIIDKSIIDSCNFLAWHRVGIGRQLVIRVTLQIYQRFNC